VRSQYAGHPALQAKATGVTMTTHNGPRGGSGMAGAVTAGLLVEKFSRLPSLVFFYLLPILLFTVVGMSAVISFWIGALGAGSAGIFLRYWAIDDNISGIKNASFIRTLLFTGAEVGLGALLAFIFITTDLSFTMATLIQVVILLLLGMLNIRSWWNDQPPYH